MAHRNGRVGNRAVLAPQAARMRKDGALFREIAAALGVSYSYAQSLIGDPDGSKTKARKDSYRQPCMDCGAETSGAEGRRAEPRCGKCAAIRAGEERTKWTRERIIEAIQWWAAEYGEPPAMPDWNALVARNRLGDEARAVRFEELFAADKVPWFSTVVYHFGSWNAGLEAAGFAGRQANGGGGNMRRSRKYMQSDKPHWFPSGGGLTMEALVLRKNGNGWIEVGVTEARSYQDAVENVADEAGEYVAVPSNMWFTVAPVKKLVASVKSAA